MGAWHSIVSEPRRGLGRVVVVSVAFLALLLSGCGGSGGAATADSEKAADLEILNEALGAELTAVAAWDRALLRLRGRALAVGRELRGHDQAHLDALTKVIRGLNGEADAEAAEPEASPPASRGEALRLAYEAENAALSQDLAAPSRLYTAAPRAVTAAIGASHAQHLVLLRQLLGVPLAGSVPDPYESGGEPPPGGG
jgi:ferritin-like protein